MLRYCLIMVIVSIAFYSSHAQKHFVTGVLQDSLTHFALRSAKISNTTKNKNVYSDQHGFFRIEAGGGDKLLITFNGYNAKTLAYSQLFRDTIIIYLSSRAKILPGVEVSSRYNQYQVDSLTRKNEFEQMRGGRLSNISRADGFGLTLNLDRFFKKRYKYQRRNEKLFKQREKNEYVAYRFSPQLVASYTGLKGQELQNFMNKHTPSYEWLRKHPGEAELFYYINEQLKLFRAGGK